MSLRRLLFVRPQPKPHDFFGQADGFAGAGVAAVAQARLDQIEQSVAIGFDQNRALHTHQS